MKNSQPTASLWSKIDDRQAEQLNGGIGSMRLTIAGGIGAAQPEEYSGEPLKVYPIGQTPKYHRLYLHKCDRYRH